MSIDVSSPPTRRFDSHRHSMVSSGMQVDKVSVSAMHSSRMDIQSPERQVSQGTVMQIDRGESDARVADMGENKNSMLASQHIGA